MKKFKIKFVWEIKCKEKCNVWLALPIQTPHQKILNLNISKEPEKIINKDLYSYLYFKTNNREKIECNLELVLKKISKYKDICNNRFLKDNRLLQLKKIRPMALKLGTPKNFYEWIINNIKFPRDLSKYLSNLNWIESSWNVLKNKEGECGGKSLLFVSLCRSVGIPARIVSGYFLKSGKINLLNAKFDKNSLELHQWSEFFDGKFWVPVDCSLAQEENRNYFGKFHEYRIVISKDINIKLIKNGYIPFLQIGEIKPKRLNNLTLTINI
jgi:transglutaminase-like putative cysteine protease